MLDLSPDDMHHNYCNQTPRASPPLLIVQSAVIYCSPAEGLLIFCLIIPVGGNGAAPHTSICQMKKCSLLEKKSLEMQQLILALIKRIEKCC